MSLHHHLPSLPSLPPLELSSQLEAIHSSSLPQSLRKSLSVDSFASHAKDSHTQPSLRPNRGNTTSTPYPPRGLLSTLSNDLNNFQSQPIHSLHSSAENEEPSASLVDSDVERSEPLSSPTERFRSPSLRAHDPQRSSLRGGLLPLPSRAPAPSTPSTPTSMLKTSSSSHNLVDLPRQRSASSVHIPPKRATHISSADSGRARSGSLGVSSAAPGKRIQIDTQKSFHETIRHSKPVTLVVIGSKGSGKSTVIKKGLSGYGLSEPSVLQEQGISPRRSTSYTLRTGKVSQPDLLCALYVVEVDVQTSDVDPSLQYDVEWPDDSPPVDGAIICYDSSDANSFKPVIGLIKGYLAKHVPIILLACKADLHRLVDPDKASIEVERLDVGLVEVTNANDLGKLKMRHSFDFVLKAVFRERRMQKLKDSEGSFRNPASPDILFQPQPWEGSRTNTPTASSSRQLQESIPSPTSSHPISHSVTPVNLPTRSRSMGNLLEDKENTQPKLAESSKPTGLRIESSTESMEEMGNPGKQPEIVPDHDEKKVEQERETILRHATLEELLDKLLFVSVSGDDPSFINHFLLTYRRFATPRSILLAMQKRMRELDKPSSDPMFACFAQMRICYLLEQWIKLYPHDFSVKGTSGALNALVRSVISKTHLIHYGSEFLPFLETFHTLSDTDAAWALKGDNFYSADESDDSVDLSDDDEIDEDLFSPDPQDYTSKDQPSTSTDNSLPPRREERRQKKSFHKTLFPGFATINQSDEIPPAKLLKDLQKCAQDIMSIDSEEIAQEITRLEVQMFLRISPRGWLNFAFTGEGERDEDEPVTAFNEMSNHLASWVGSLILCHDKQKNRTRQIEKFIEIAQRLRMLNNYSALRAVVAGINSSAPAGDETIALFKARYPEHSKHLQSWEVLLSQRRASLLYRMALRNSKGCCIPALEIHMADLLKSHEANPDYHPDDRTKIHWGKFGMIGRLIDTTTRYQAQCLSHNDYNFQDRSYIMELIARPVMSSKFQDMRLGYDPPDGNVSSNRLGEMAALRRMFLW